LKIQTENTCKERGDILDVKLLLDMKSQKARRLLVRNPSLQRKGQVTLKLKRTNNARSSLISSVHKSINHNSNISPREYQNLEKNLDRLRRIAITPYKMRIPILPAYPARRTHPKRDDANATSVAGNQPYDLIPISTQRRIKRKETQTQRSCRKGHSERQENR